MEQPVDLAAGVRMAENGQAEGRLGDEDVAGHRLERSAGRVLSALVVAGNDHPFARMFEDDLRRSEDVAGRPEADVHLADPHGFAISDRIAVLVAVAGRHDRQRFRSRPALRVPAARVIGMAVRDEGPGLRLRGIDPRVGGAYVDAFGKRLYPGTEACHRELYSRNNRRFTENRAGGGSFNGRNLVDADGHSRSGDPSDPLDLGRAPRTEAQG